LGALLSSTFSAPLRVASADLLTAFRQDQTITRYETFDDLLGYCHYSANPVGHLVLYLCGYRDAERQQLSDFTCTALQLANFWQDVSVDYEKDRIYLPLEDLRRFAVTENDIAQKDNSRAFRDMMRFEVQRAREWFSRGLPLAGVSTRTLVEAVGARGVAGRYTACVKLRLCTCWLSSVTITVTVYSPGCA